MTKQRIVDLSLPIIKQLDSIKNGERKGRYMEGHRAAGSRGICILEWLTNLDQLPKCGFTVYAFPVKF